MSDDVIQDLKQFITGTVRTTIREEVSVLSKRIDGLEGRMDTLETKVDDLTHFVTDAIDTSNAVHGEQLKDHERRITKLEAAA